jgi:hypothetical protein
MLVNNEKMNYRLGPRINQLPRIIYKTIKMEFNQLPKANERRWQTITKDEATDLRAREAIIFIKHIGCNLEELMNPAINLQAIYLERVQKPEKDHKAARYGLADFS